MTTITVASSVYFVIAPEVRRIKIGFSLNPQSRFEGFVAGSPCALVLYGTVPGGAQDESYLHRIFAQYRLHGEWFDATADVMRVIDEIIKAGDVSRDKSKSRILISGKRCLNPDEECARPATRYWFGTPVCPACQKRFRDNGDGKKRRPWEIRGNGSKMRRLRNDL